MGQMFMILHYFQVVCQDLPKILEFHEKSHCLQLRFKHLFYLSSNPLSFYYHLAFYIKKKKQLPTMSDCPPGCCVNFNIFYLLLF